MFSIGNSYVVYVLKNSTDYKSIGLDFTKFLQSERNSQERDSTSELCQRLPCIISRLEQIFRLYIQFQILDYFCPFRMKLNFDTKINRGKKYTMKLAIVFSLSLSLPVRDLSSAGGGREGGRGSIGDQILIFDRQGSYSYQIILESCIKLCR